MPDPTTPERLAEIRRQLEAHKETHGLTIAHLRARELLAEVERIHDLEYLAGVLWTARARSLGDADDDQPFEDASARLRAQYRRFAEEVTRLIARGAS